MVAPVLAAEALARGARTEFAETYKRYVTGVSARLARIMELGVPSDKASEIYPYFESAPHPSRWPRGQDIPRDSFRARNFTVENHDWAKAVDFHENDLQDDQTRSMMDRVREVASGFAILDERVLFQFLTGAADPDLMPAVPNAPDGAALFSTTDGAGAARFGLAGGNTIDAPAGIGSVAALTTDLYTAISRFLRFLDTKGQPLFLPEMVKSLVVIFGSANEEVFRRAFEQKMVQGTNAGISNVIKDTGLAIELWSTPRITDNDWFVGLLDLPRKAIFKQIRQPLRDNVEDFTNSDRTRRTKIRAVQWDSRSGYGIALPYGLIRVNN